MYSGETIRVPESAERPDLWYWRSSYAKRCTVSEEELHKLIAEVEKYDRKRFVFGRRFRLLSNYHGVPAGVCCTVIREWPETTIRWDKWDGRGYGSQRSEEDMHFELDTRLAHVEGT